MQISLKEEFDVQAMVDGLTNVGGFAFPILEDGIRMYLADLALSYSYTKREEVVQQSGVRQDLSGFDDFDASSPFVALRDAWQGLSSEKIALFESDRPLFTTPPVFNEMSLQKYEVGSTGITPHMDQKICINLICVVILCGNCRFCVCADKKGSNPHKLDARPGNMVMLRAPGFMGEQYRPHHFLTDIVGPRISFGMRHNTKL